MTTTLRCVAVTLVATAPTATCPLCGHRTARVHSRYSRTLADLPWAGAAVRLTLRVRKFFCTLAACPRRVFTERLPDLAAPYARKTARLADILRLVGFALGGEAGARLVARLGMAASPRTLLRLLRRTPPVERPTPRVLGVDEWAFRRGCRAGTILVDLERHQPVDLLAESSDAAFAAWLREHPGVEIISRDRGAAYAAGGVAGAPTARHVADRWHLLKNLGEALQRLLGRHTDALRQAARDAAAAAGAAAPAAVPRAAPPPRRARPRKAPRLSAQQARQRTAHEQVRALAARGWSIKAIARHLTLHKRTVRKYRDMERFVDQRGTARPSTVEPYRAYAEQRWAAGCTQVKQLWEELQAQGFRGSYKSVWQFTRGWPVPERAPEDAPAPVPPRQKTRTPRQAMWLLLRAPDALEADDAAYREALCRACPEIAAAAALAQAFGHLLRAREAAALDLWLAEAEASGLGELRRFALGLRQDDAAVRAALELPWSQGQTEGQVTRLKLVKRQMYGRANFDLLRLRVLHAA